MIPLNLNLVLLFSHSSKLAYCWVTIKRFRNSFSESDASNTELYNLVTEVVI